jgi:hypothetical protein
MNWIGLILHPSSLREVGKPKRNVGVTQIIEMPNRGHALTIDNGWREVANAALMFVQRFACLMSLALQQ